MEQPHQSPAPGAPPNPAAGERVVASQDLFRGDRVVTITHAGERYRLLVTKNDKLILQK